MSFYIEYIDPVLNSTVEQHIEWLMNKGILKGLILCFYCSIDMVKTKRMKVKENTSFYLNV